MSWWVALSGGMVLLLSLFLLGVPIFVAFVVLNVIGVLVFFGVSGFGLFANSIYSTATLGALSAVPLFIVMGEILFRSGAMDVLFELARPADRAHSRAAIRALHRAIGDPGGFVGRRNGGGRPARPLAVSHHAQARLRHPVLGRDDPGGREPRSDHSAERARGHHRDARGRVSPARC